MSLLGYVISPASVWHYIVIKHSSSTFKAMPLWLLHRARSCHILIPQRINGSGTPAEYTQVLQTLAYTHSDSGPGNPTAGNRYGAWPGYILLQVCNKKALHQWLHGCWIGSAEHYCSMSWMKPVLEILLTQWAQQVLMTYILAFASCILWLC